MERLATDLSNRKTVYLFIAQNRQDVFAANVANCVHYIGVAKVPGMTSNSSESPVVIPFGDTFVRTGPLPDGSLAFFQI